MMYLGDVLNYKYYASLLKIEIYIIIEGYLIWNDHYILKIGFKMYVQDVYVLIILIQ